MPRRKPPAGTNLPRPGGPLPTRVTLAVSFRHLDSTDPFVTTGCGPGYLIALLDRLRDICRMTADEFRLAGRALRSHQIRWDATSRPGGFGLPDVIARTGVPWQFGLSANEHGRVHGLLAGDRFYVVWLDPTHQLYPATG